MTNGRESMREGTRLEIRGTMEGRYEGRGRELLLFQGCVKKYYK
jgi:hypothetical protein